MDILQMFGSLDLQNSLSKQFQEIQQAFNITTEKGNIFIDAFKKVSSSFILNSKEIDNFSKSFNKIIEAPSEINKNIGLALNIGNKEIDEFSSNFNKILSIPSKITKTITINNNLSNLANLSKNQIIESSLSVIINSKNAVSQIKNSIKDFSQTSLGNFKNSINQAFLSIVSNTKVNNLQGLIQDIFKTPKINSFDGVTNLQKYFSKLKNTQLNKNSIEDLFKNITNKVVNKDNTKNAINDVLKQINNTKKLFNPSLIKEKVAPFTNKINTSKETVTSNFKNNGTEILKNLIINPISQKSLPIVNKIKNLTSYQEKLTNFKDIPLVKNIFTKENQNMLVTNSDVNKVKSASLIGGSNSTANNHNNNQTYNINISSANQAIDTAKEVTKELGKIELLSMIGG